MAFSRPFLTESYKWRQADLKATAAQVEANAKAYEQKQRNFTTPTKDISYAVSKAEEEKEKR